MSAAAEPLTFGTAGHIDHGKTELVRALTGRDTDRLPQERARGISIELGYAPLRLRSGRRVSVVDVPGHERFVRTMVAGASGIDGYLMAIAADDGLMPQTREHAAVLEALGVEHGVVAVTKSDLADPAAALQQAATLLPGAECVAVSARTGAGIEELRAALDRLAATLPSRADAGGAVRLHIDRAFTIRGAGTVVTGTLWSGRLAREDELLLLPRGLPVRVRALQVHDEPCELALAGQRVAVNLARLALRDVARGDVLAAPEAQLAASYVIDAALVFSDRAREPEHGARVQVHHGTRETPARVARLGGRFFQLRLEHPLVAAVRDRIVIRRIAPPDTLGGGVVLDPAARRHGTSNDVIVALTRVARGLPPVPAPAPGSGRRPERAAPAEPRPLSDAARALDARLREAWIEPPGEHELSDAERAVLPALHAAKLAVRVGRTLHYNRDALAEIERRVVGLIERDGSVTLAGLRDELGTTRKFAQALLEHFDGARLTLRRPDDSRVLRRRAVP